MGQDTEVLVVGAGPYGVAIAHELWRRGVGFVVLGHPFRLWFEGTLSDAALRSDSRTSEVYTQDDRYDLLRSLGQRYGADAAQSYRHRRVPVSLYREYLCEVLEELPFPIVRSHVHRLEREAEGFRAVGEHGLDLRARNVVIAAGLGGHVWLPEALRELDPRRVVHASRVADYEGVKGRRVLVVGSGQSAGEAVQHLAPDNELSWVGRHAPVYHADPIALPRPVFHAVLKAAPLFGRMPEALRAGLSRFFVGATMTPDLKEVMSAESMSCFQGSVEDLRLRDRGDETVSEELSKGFDLVVACTGYRPRVAGLEWIESELRRAIPCDRKGQPRLDAHYQTGVPGLFAAGCLAEASHGPSQRFMIGSRYAAAGVAEAVQARRATRSAPVRRRARPSPAASGSAGSPPGE